MSQMNKRIVIVLCPNGRRVTVKTSSSTSICQIIEEACLKQSFDPLNYNLKHLKRVLDPSSTLHYSNIPNHAQLELTEAPVPRKESYVTLNLVTEKGQRLIADFSPSSTLWEILLHHDNKDESFSLPTPESSCVPFIVYTMKKIIGDELKSTTLKSLGLFNGRCMIRYNVQQLPDGAESIGSSQNVIVQPQVKTVLPKSDQENECAKEIASNECFIPKTTNGSSQFEEMDCTQFLELSERSGSSLANESSPSEVELPSPSSIFGALKTSEIINSEICETKDVKNEMEEKQNESTQTCAASPFIPLSDHDSILFSLDDAPSFAQSHETDDFFELTTDEVRRLYHDQVRHLREMEETPLMTQQLRQLEKDSRLLSAMNRHPVTQLRICFPDRHVIQANFKPRNTIREVMDFLSPLLIAPNMNFYLYTTFPRTVLEPGKSLVEAGCIPKARLYFGADDDLSQFLSEESLKKKSSFDAASRAVVKSKMSETIQLERTTESPPLSSNLVSQPRTQTKEPDIVASNRNVPRTSQKPKWFKLNTK